MATFDRSQLPAPVPRSMRIALENRDGAVWLSLTPCGGAPPLSIRLQPNDAVGMGSELLELGLLLDNELNVPQGH